MGTQREHKNSGIQENADADVIVLGVGTSGEDLSLQLLDAGLDVIGIQEGLVGGECPYWACIPSKVMTRAANALQEARRVGDLAGVIDVNPQWEKTAKRVRWITGGWDDSTAVQRYKERGGKMVKGRGKLAGPRTVSVGDKTFTARKGVVIAVGSKFFIPPIPGLDEVDYWTTHDVIQMEKLPESMIIIGGGATGCELGQALARFNVDMTIVEADDRLLSKEEPEASEVVESTFEEEGIKIKAGTRAEKVEKKDDNILVHLDNGEKIEAERLFIATGKTIDLSDLGLETVGLDNSASHIEVDDQMRAGDGLWAMGDVTGKSLLTHVAVYQAEIIAADILGKEHRPASYHAIPRAIFTDPEVGGVGLTEAEARAEGYDVLTTLRQIPATFRGVTYGVERGIVKTVVDRESGTLIGATVAGPQASDMLGVLNLAVHARLPLETLRTMMFTFPAYSSVIGEALGGFARGLTTVVDPEYEGAELLDEVV